MRNVPKRLKNKLNPDAAAKLIGVHPATVRRLIKSGILKIVEKYRGTNYLSKAEVIRYKKIRDQFKGAI